EADVAPRCGARRAETPRRERPPYPGYSRGARPARPSRAYYCHEGAHRQASIEISSSPFRRASFGPRGLDRSRSPVDDPGMATTLERAEAAEHALSQELDQLVIMKSVIYVSGEHDPRAPLPRPPDQGKRYLMGHDPRLPRMPERPTLFDFFTHRFGPANHLLQSARLAQKSGAGEKLVLACLLHDIAIAGFIRG